MNHARLAAWALTLSLCAPAAAHAKGTHFVVELSTGVGESAYAAGPMGLAYGLSLGTSFRLNPIPIRWYLLGTVVSRNGTASGSLEGQSFAADQRDLDLYGAVRAVLPVWEPIRIYAETGFGQRRQWQTLRRGGDLAEVSFSDSEPLIILAAGLQARVSETFSFGLRAELSALDPDPGLSPLSLDLAPTTNRTALLAQVGVHF